LGSAASIASNAARGIPAIVDKCNNNDANRSAAISAPVNVNGIDDDDDDDNNDGSVMTAVTVKLALVFALFGCCCCDDVEVDDAADVGPITIIIDDGDVDVDDNDGGDNGEDATAAAI
jgi:hypothetical protein